MGKLTIAYSLYVRGNVYQVFCMYLEYFSVFNILLPPFLNFFMTCELGGPVRTGRGDFFDAPACELSTHRSGVPI